MSLRSSLLSLSDDALSIVTNFVPLSALARLLSTSPALKQRLNAATLSLSPTRPSAVWDAPTEILVRFATPFRNPKTLFIPSLSKRPIEETNMILGALLPANLTKLQVGSLRDIVLLCQFLDASYSHINDSIELKDAVRNRFKSLQYLSLAVESVTLQESELELVEKYLATLPISTFAFRHNGLWDLLLIAMGIETLDTLTITPHADPQRLIHWQTLSRCSALTRLSMGVDSLPPEIAFMLPRGLRHLELSYWRNAMVDLSFMDSLPPTLASLELSGYVDYRDAAEHLAKKPKFLEELNIHVLSRHPELWQYLPRSQPTLTANTSKELNDFSEQQIRSLPPSLKTFLIGAISPDFLLILPCASHLVHFTLTLIPMSLSTVESAVDHDSATFSSSGSSSASPPKPSRLDTLVGPAKADLEVLGDALAAMTSLEHLRVRQSEIPGLTVSDFTTSLRCKLQSLAIKGLNKPRVDLLDWHQPWSSKLASIEVSKFDITDPTIDASVWQRSLPMGITDLTLESTMLTSPSLLSLLPKYLANLYITLKSFCLIDTLPLLPRTLTICNLTLDTIDYLHTSHAHFNANVPPLLGQFTLVSVIVIVHSTEQGRLDRTGEAEAHSQTQHKTGRSRLTEELETFQTELGAPRKPYLSMSFYPGCYSCK